MKARPAKNGTNSGRRSVATGIELPPVPTHFDSTIRSYAREVASTHLRSDLGEPAAFVAAIDPEHFNKAQQRKLDPGPGGRRFVF